MPQFEVEVGGNIAPITKSLADLKARLKELQFDIANSTDAAAIVLLNKELRETEAEVKRIKNIGPVIGSGAVGGINSATLAVGNLGRVAQDLPFGFIGISNNLNPLLESFQRLRAETGSGKAAIQALGSSLLGAGGLGLALSIITAGLSIASVGLQAWGIKNEEAKKKTDAFNDAVKGAFKSTADEAARVAVLVQVLKSDAESRERKNAALKELQNLAPENFKNLTLEKAAVGELDKAYQSYLANLQNVVTVKVLQAQLEQLIESKLKKQGQTVFGIAQIATLKGQKDELQRLQAEYKKTFDPNLSGRINFLTQSIKVQEGSLSSLDIQIEEVSDNIRKLTSGVELHTGATKKDKDALKERLDALEKIKKVTTDANALVGLQESIFDLQVKISLRDQQKNHLSNAEVQQQIKGFQKDLNESFKNQALALELTTKAKFSPVAFIEIPPNLSFFKQVDGKKIASIAQSDIGKATGNEKITITLHNARVLLNGKKLTAVIEGKEAINAKLTDEINGALENLQIDLSGSLGEALGEAFATAIQGGDLSEGLKSAAKAILGILGSTMQTIGRYVIGAAIKIQLLKKVLSTWAIKNPALAVLAGIGLIAAGAALKNATFEGPKFAKGGIVTGPTIGMIGEAGKEAIIPLNKLGSMIGGQSATTVILKGSLSIRGRELVALLEQEQTRFNRIR